ncbi:hypothetical protein ACFLWR_07225 [Chloroflexota bacterium]
MNSKRSTEIGFKAQVKLEWLDYVSSLVSSGYDIHTIEGLLHDQLREKLSVGSNAKNGSRARTISTLKRIWVKAPDEVESLRKNGLKLLDQLSRKEHLILHWGMSIAAYPFVGMVAMSVGRLLKLQGRASASQVQRRLKERYGDRETVDRATRHIIRNFVEWGVLLDGDNPGVYEPAFKQNVTDPEIITWLIECILSMNEDEKTPIRMAFDSPILFPFKITSISSDVLGKYGNIQVIHHGLNEELIERKT